MSEEEEHIFSIDYWYCIITELGNYVISQLHNLFCIFFLESIQTSMQNQESVAQKMAELCN